MDLAAKAALAATGATLRGALLQGRERLEVELVWQEALEPPDLLRVRVREDTKVPALDPVKDLLRDLIGANARVAHELVHHLLAARICRAQ